MVIGSAVANLNSELVCPYVGERTSLEAAPPKSSVFPRPLWPSSVFEAARLHIAIRVMTVADPVWIDSHASWRAWIRTPGVEAGPALEMMDDWEAEYIRGSPQEFVRSGILRGFPDFLKSDVFSVGHSHALRFQ
jgi:hypothetical protein